LKLVDVITGKYFMGKEKIVGHFCELMQEELIEIDKASFV
jgi:hypothetical protein